MFDKTVFTVPIFMCVAKKVGKNCLKKKNRSEHLGTTQSSVKSL